MMGPMDDGMRAELRALARRAEWAAPSAGQNDAEACARQLREVGRELAGRVADGEDRDTWAFRAATELAAHCRQANASWSVDDVAELARLRDAALIALAPPPGSADMTERQEEPPATEPERSWLASLPGGRRAAVIGLVVLGCAALVGIVVAGSGGSGHAGTVASLPTVTATAMSPATAPATAAATATAASVAAATSPFAAEPTVSAPSASVSLPATSPAPESTVAAGTVRVTAIQMTATPASGYPEVQIFGTITASGTGNIVYTVTVAGTSGAPQVSTEDESGQTSYALSQTVYLQPWCGQKSVTVTVASGAVSRSASVQVAGC